MMTLKSTRNFFALFFFIFINTCILNFSIAQGSDNASDAAYNSGWTSGTNGGTGFGTWAISAPTNSGTFVANSDIGQSWGTFANSGATLSATRNFNTAMTTDDSFVIQMDNGNIQNGGTVGFSLKNANGDDLMEFFFIGGGSNYSIRDNGGTVATSVGFTNGGLTITVTLTSATQFTVAISTNGGTNETITGKTLITNANQNISRIRLFNANAGGGGASDAFFNNMSHVVVLPVQLTIFEAISKRDQINLVWQTTSELNNSHFEIQRSNNLKTWKTIDEITGNGTTNDVQNYNYTDKTPSQNVNYYRLKQFDYDGAFEYSPIVSADRNKAEIFTISPNIVNDEIVISFATEQRKGTDVSIYNINGQLIRQITLIDKLLNMNINVHDLEKGMYFIRYDNDSTQQIQRFIKQ